MMEEMEGGIIQLVVARQEEDSVQIQLGANTVSGRLCLEINSHLCNSNLYLILSKYPSFLRK